MEHLLGLGRVLGTLFVGAGVAFTQALPRLAALDPTVAAPVAAVTAMLVALFGVFMRESARSDKRVDTTNAMLIAALEAERDRYAKLVEEIETRIRADIQKERESEREAWDRQKDFLYKRIRDLEGLLYGEKAPGPGEPGSPT